ncbi:MAG: hypothetical protein FWD52_04270 [Candidatus Bathyarchaeota archaeon]|nr:hypothetical protein [Candidatus Termiticorpusculum sp.]
MKIEKKLIALSIFAIAIGIATVLPMTVFMNAKAQTDIADSLFNIDIPCAYYNANITYNVEINDIVHEPGGQRTYDFWYRGGSVIAVQPSINLTVLDDNALARIEFLEYSVYTDKLQLDKSYSYFAFNEEAFGQIDDQHIATKYLAEKLVPNKRIGGQTYGGLSTTDPTEPMIRWIAGNMDSIGVGSGRSLDKQFYNILAAIEDTQTIYLDVRRVAYISLSKDGTMVIVEDNKLLQNLELTKNDDGFMFGNPAAVKIETYFRLPEIPYKGTDLPEKFWPEVFGKNPPT